MARHTRNRRQTRGRRRQTRGRRTQRGGFSFFSPTVEELKEELAKMDAKKKEIEAQIQEKNSTENKNGSEGSWTDSITSVFKSNPDAPVTTNTVTSNPVTNGGRRRRRHSQKRKY